MTANPLPAARPVTPLAIVSEELRTLVADASQLNLNPQFIARLAKACELASGLDPYVEACTTPESGALANLVERTRREPWQHRFNDGETQLALEQEMLSGHVEGQFLKMLVHATGARRILEIGMFSGYSALAMAEALPANGELIALEIDPYAAEFARQGFPPPLDSQIQIMVGSALASLDTLVHAGDQFDLIFIDADKPSYSSYVDRIVEGGLLAKRGLICVDNTLMQGLPYIGATTQNGRAIEAFNRHIAEDPRLVQVMLPLRDGLTLIRLA